MIYLLRKSDTGSFQELAHASDVEFGQLSLLTVAPKCTRGGHYHTHKKEWFCCIHGRCYISTTDVRTNDLRTIELNDDSKEFAIVKPYESHVVLNYSDLECELLVVSSEEYDPDNTDTITYNGE